MAFLSTSPLLQGWTSASLHNITFHYIPIPPLPTSIPNNTHYSPSHLFPVWDFVIHHLRSPISTLLHSLSFSSLLILIHGPLMSHVAHDSASIPSMHTFQFQGLPAIFQLIICKRHPSKPQLGNHILYSPLPNNVFEEGWAFTMKHYFETPFKGIIFNTSLAIKEPFIDFLAKEDDFVGKKIFAVGPMNPPTFTDYKSGPRPPCLEWLNKQPPKSVVYVAFGSTTTIAVEQIEEIALGLEKRKQRFIWVLMDADRGDVSKEAKLERARSLLLDFNKRVEGVE